MDDLLAAADKNMRRVWDALVATAPEARRHEDDEVLLLASGVPATLFNPAFVLAPPDDPDALVDRIVEHYGAGNPFVVYFRDAVAASVAEAATRAGLVEWFQPPLMTLDPIPAERDPLPEGVTLEAVDASNVDAYSDVLCAAFGTPSEIGALIANALGGNTFVGVLARLGGQPVATSGLHLSDDVAGIYCVATVPEARGRGIGAAVTWETVHLGREAGATRSVLQASREGQPVYTRMGFTTLDRYRQFEAKAAD